jgi:TPR repeat protein
MKAVVGLATMFYFGDPVPQDLARAAGLFQEAAAKGSAIAAFNLGYMYDTGSGVDADRTLALRWYRYADVLGYDPAGSELKRLGQ